MLNDTLLEITKNIEDKVGGGRFFSPQNYVNTIDSENKDFSGDFFSENPEDAENGLNFSFDSNVLYYPEDLGSNENSYYVRFDVFIVDTGNESSLDKVKGESAANVYLEENGTPRIAQGPDSIEIRGNKFKKISEMISLPMPESIATDHSILWSRSEGGFVQNLISYGDLLKENGSGRTISSIINSIGQSVAGGLAGLADSAGVSGAGTALKLATKKTANPRNEFLFDGVNNRAFNFSWKFIPRTEREAIKLNMILEKMKLYMYPELDQSTNGNYYIFPGIFDITFMTKFEENNWLFRTSSCALTNLIINYTGAGQWVAMDNFVESGAPVAWDVTMQFSELEFLHRSRFKNSFNPEGVAR